MKVIFNKTSGSKTKILLLFCFLYTFILSITILPFATKGDNYYYDIFYNAIPELSFIEGFFYQKEAIDSYEPVFFLFYYFSSAILHIDRIFILSILNSILAILMTNWLIKNRVSIIIIFLIFINFYLMVLFFSAERLKIALIFIILGFTIKNRFGFLFLTTATLAHLQTFTFLFSTIMHNLIYEAKKLTNLKLSTKLLTTLVVFILSILILLGFQDQLTHKINSYESKANLMGNIKVFIFVLLSFYYSSKEKTKEILSAFIPILFLTSIIGGERVVIMAYFIFMYYGLRFRRGINLGVISSCTYFAIKGLLFLADVIKYNDGFYYLYS